MLVKAELQGYVFLACPNNQVVWAGFHIVHYFQGVRLDLIGISHIPHEEPLRENQDGASDPVVVNQEMPIREAVYLQPDQVA